MAKGTPNTGVYLIINTVDGKRYVGSTGVSLPRRLKSHRTELAANRHVNRYLQRAWNKHGQAAFQFVVHERCPEERCIQREQFWMDTFDSANPAVGYNLSPTAGSVKGLVRSEESKRKNSERSRQHFSTEEGRAKASAAAKIRFSDPRQREHLSVINKGKKLSSATRAKMSAFQKIRYQSPEARRLMSESGKRAWADPVIREKMLKANARQSQRRLNQP